MNHKNKPAISLKTVNKTLLVVIAVINLWVIGLPLYSVGVFWWQKHITRQPQKLAQVVKTLPARPSDGKYAAGEHLLIPSIALDENIYEGQTARTLDQGIWHWPGSASPGQTGNSVFLGHRFIYIYNGDVAFEHLDLIKKGDKITVVWQGKKFSYTVSEIKVVAPTDTSIIQPTKDKRITLYTCTPMWTSKMRLAIIAQQDKP